MKTQKQNYLSPVTETLVVRFEGVVCQSFSDNSTQFFSWDEEEDL